MFNFLKNNQMKKVFLFFAVAMIFASCAPKATEEAVETEEATEAVVEVVEVADSTVVDTTVAE